MLTTQRSTGSPIEPASLALARSLVRPLTGVIWAIGGSTLLHRLGLENAPRDLDIVTTVDSYPQVERTLTALLGNGVRPEHDICQSQHFARFAPQQGAAVDLMAGIQARVNGQLVAWEFRRDHIAQHDGLPWMSASDWLELYSLFDRPQRVRQLQAHLRVG